MTQKQYKQKRTYEKPRLRTIDLVAEEVLAVGCKNENNTAVNQALCGPGVPCVEFGS